jgi:hypothetical protein
VSGLHDIMAQNLRAAQETRVWNIRQFNRTSALSRWLTGPLSRPPDETTTQATETDI